MFKTIIIYVQRNLKINLLSRMMKLIHFTINQTLSAHKITNTQKVSCRHLESFKNIYK